MKRWVERDWDAEGLPVQLQAQVERLRRQGRLPLAAFGEFSARHLLQPLPDLLWRYRQEIERWPEAVEQQQELRHRHPSGLKLEDWLGGLRRDASGRLARLQLLSGKLHEGRSFVAQPGTPLVAAPRPATSRPAGEQRAGEPDRHPGDSAAAERARRRVPRPVDRRLAPGHAPAVAGGLPDRFRLARQWWRRRARKPCARRASATRRVRHGGEVDASPALARVYPDFDRLLASGEFAHWAEQLYAPLLAALGRGAEEQA